MNKNPARKLLIKFYKYGSLSEKQIKKITKKNDDLSRNEYLNSLLDENLVEYNEISKYYIDGTQIGFFEVDKNKPYRITVKGQNLVYSHDKTFENIKYAITTIIAFLGLTLSLVQFLV